MAATEIDRLELGPMENFIYLVHDTDSGRTAVVDPAWDVGAILDVVQQRGTRVTDILLTHSHHDHINGISEVLDQYDAELHLLKAENEFWGETTLKPTLHHGGDHIRIGKTDIEILHTPGHTPGSACYRLDEKLITGDTMFVFGCGRCDLRGGDPNTMYDTLRKMAAIPGDTLILPGHNYGACETSTIAEQVQGNPFMLCESEKEFVEYRMHIHDRCRHGAYEAMDPEVVHRQVRTGKC